MTAEIADPKTAPEPGLLTAEQAWEFCALSKSAWYKARASGKIPAPVKIGGALRWRLEELRLWIAAGCPPAAKWENLRNPLPKRRK